MIAGLPRVTRTIEQEFARSASTYDQSSIIQKIAAEKVAQTLRQTAKSIVPGPILEIGCGTGHLSSYLTEIFPDRDIVFLDIADSMIEHCRTRLQNRDYLDPSRWEFVVADAHNYFSKTAENNKYALIVSSFTLHWLNDLRSTLKAALGTLAPGGQFIFNALTMDSFPEWKNICKELGSPCTVNSLPSLFEFHQTAKDTDYSFTYYQYWLNRQYTSALEFFRNLKSLGANGRLANSQDTEFAETSRLRSLIKYWDQKSPYSISISYRVLEGLYVKRPKKD